MHYKASWITRWSLKSLTSITGRDFNTVRVRLIFHLILPLQYYSRDKVGDWDVETALPDPQVAGGNFCLGSRSVPCERQPFLANLRSSPTSNLSSADLGKYSCSFSLLLALHIDYRIQLYLSNPCIISVHGQYSFLACP